MQEEEYPELLYQISSHKGGFVLYFLLRLLISVVLAIQVKNGDWQKVPPDKKTSWGKRETV